MSKIFENIATIYILWGMCLAVGIIFNYDYIQYKKEYKEKGKIIIKKGKNIYRYNNPQNVITFNAVGMILGYLSAIAIIVITIIYS